MARQIVIGTRGSRLALWQANFVAEAIKSKNRGYGVSLKKIKTTGDKILDSPLAKIGDKGLFVKEIEHVLARGEVDLAVHSMKDLPTDIPADLTIAAVTKREDPFDALISREGTRLKDLRPGAVIGTSSLRRRAQLLAYRPDLTFVDLRGNVDTRVRKMYEQNLDAIILSGVGLIRLGWGDRITERISYDVMVPGVGQGAIAIEARRDDQEILELASLLNDSTTERAVLAERALLRRLEGGCQVPLGALAVIEDHKLVLEAAVASVDGSELIRDSMEGEPEQPEELGIRLAEKLLERGADIILEEIRKGTV
ncbi:MAG: hydroxymethylbilane synthase [Actinomycetota bacterium]